MLVAYKKIPTYNVQKNEWSYTSFDSQEDFASYLDSLWNDECEYNFDETSYIFNKEARFFTKNGFYTDAQWGSAEHKAYFKKEKEKCRKGVIYINNDKQWYLTREYYMLLNFLPIANKEKGGRDTFMDVRDIQYHLALYEKRAEAKHKHAVLCKKRQMASEQPHSEPVLASYGWTTMGDLKVGDKLVRPYGGFATIIHKTFHKDADVYNFIFDDGREVRCGIEHNWWLYDYKYKTYKRINTKELLEIPLKNRNQYRFSVDQINPIDLPERNLSIDPYVLGVLLGDGSLVGDSINFRCEEKDLEIRNETFKILGEDYEYGKSKETNSSCHKYSIKYKKRFNFKDRDRIHGVNPLIRNLSEYNLKYTNSHTKRIPEEYKFGSISQRISLVQGLMDTDGFINANGNDINFTSCNKLLCEDLLFILRSLGIKCQIRDFNSFYRVRISGKISFSLFRLKRKLERQNKRGSKKTFDRTNLIKIEKLDYKENSSCIVLDSEDHLYITKDFVTTHNSLFHCAKTLNQIWFEKNAICKIFASDKGYLEGDNGIWKFYVKYREHLNTHTGWIRSFSPDKELSWTQRKEINVDGNKQYTGLMSVLVGVTLKQSATAGVGGMSMYAFHEEFGIAPKGDQTYNFFKPAVTSGIYTTGMFIGAGSVGDLTQCQPLKQYVYKPEANDFLGVVNTWVNKSRIPTITGLYIPEHWGMPGFIDEYGNSDKMAAFHYLENLYKEMKDNPGIKPEEYQTMISQKPIYMDDAFKFRKVSEFPIDKLEPQQSRIEEKEQKRLWKFKPIKCILKETDSGKIEMITHGLPPEHGYPIKETWEDKRGVVTIYELPYKENPEFFTYFGGVDTVEADFTRNSDSIATCDIVVKARHVKYKDDKGVIRTRLEGDKLVATYRGRYNPNSDTNHQIWLLIKMYNAFTLVERNKPNFINDMKREGRERYLARESDLSIFKDINVNNTFGNKSPYGFNKGTENSTLWTYMKDIGKEYLLKEFDYIYKNDGSIIRPLRGIDRIDDYWLLEELIQYAPDVNTDRVVSFFAALTLAKQFEIEKGIETVSEIVEDPPIRRETSQFESLLGGLSTYKTTHKNNGLKTLL